MANTTSDVHRLCDYIGQNLGPMEIWPAHPGGWPDEIEAALLDAIFSAAARYGGENTGVRAVVKRWRQRRGGGSINDLDAMVAEVDGLGGADQFQRVLCNGQRVPGGSHRITKAEAVYRTAGYLRDRQVGTAEELHAAVEADPSRMKSAFTTTPGVGYATWHYFLLLLKVDTVKVDRMITRFVTTAVGPRSREEIHRLVTAAAGNLSVPVHRLDHAIWRWQRRQRSG